MVLFNNQPCIYQSFIIKFYQNWNTHRTMRNNYQQRPKSPFLPVLTQTTSRKPISTLTRRNVKQNHICEQNMLPNFKKELPHQCLAKKKCLTKGSTPFEDLINKKLLENTRMDIPTQPKTKRPWAAQELDLNNMITKTSKLTTLLFQNNKNESLRRNSCQKSQTSSTQELSLKTTKMINKTTRLLRGSGTREISLPRQKIYSCKIALKRGIFPMNQKKRQIQKVTNFFKDESMSTIYNQDQNDSEEEFISFKSYLNIQF